MTDLLQWITPSEYWINRLFSQIDFVNGGFNLLTTIIADNKRYNWINKLKSEIFKTKNNETRTYNSRQSLTHIEWLTPHRFSLLLSLFNRMRENPFLLCLFWLPGSALYINAIRRLYDWPRDVNLYMCWMVEHYNFIIYCNRIHTPMCCVYIQCR